MTRLLIAIVLVLGIQIAQAFPITYQYTGAVNEATGIFAGQGASINGTFSFDSGLLDSVSGDNTTDLFNNYYPVSNQPLTDKFTASLTVGTTTVNDQATIPYDVEASLLLTDKDGAYDSVRYTMDRVVSINHYDPYRFILEADDSQGIAINPGSGSLTNTIAGAIDVLDNLDLTKFATLGRSRWEIYDTTGNLSDYVRFTWTGLSRIQSVPEPASLSLLGLGLVGMIFASRKIIKS